MNRTFTNGRVLVRYEPRGYRFVRDRAIGRLVARREGRAYAKAWGDRSDLAHQERREAFAFGVLWASAAVICAATIIGLLRL